jgi:Tol biopolymer transport system component
MSPARGDEHVFPLSIAADGRIAALQTAKDGRTTLVLLTRDKPPEVLITGPFDEMSAAFSPDGASIAYDADENGRREVYVQRLDTHARTQISTNGGERPSWSRDGRSIYFHEGARFVRVTPGAADGGAAARDVLFDRPDGRVVGVSPEGRLLIEREPPSLDSAIVVLQWMREVRERLPLPVASPR